MVEFRQSCEKDHEKGETKPEEQNGRALPDLKHKTTLS